VISPNLIEETMTMKNVKHTSKCTYRVDLNPECVFSTIADGEGKGTTQRVLLSQCNGGQYTSISWMLTPKLGGAMSKAIQKILGEKKLSAMIQQALKNSAQIDINHLEGKK
jgi:hypothetical protein